MSRRVINKDIGNLIKQAERQGWEVTYTNGGHYKWVSPVGAFFYSASTPSDPRSIQHLKRDLRVNGFLQIEKKGRRKQ